MKKFFKFMLGVGGCIFYYIVVCALLDIDVFDPWEKAMKWVKSNKKEREDFDDNTDEDSMMDGEDFDD